MQKDEDGRRFLMWCDLLDDYRAMTPNQKKHAKINYAAERGLTPHDFTPDLYEEIMSGSTATPSYWMTAKTATNHLATAQSQVRAELIQSILYEQIVSFANLACTPTKETTMDTDTRTQQNYAVSRLDSISYTHRDQLRKDFNLDGETTPSNPKEVVERLTSGKYVFSRTAQNFLKDMDEDGEVDGYTYRDSQGSPWYGIEWRDPAKPADMKGYDAANEKLSNAYNKAVDKVKLSEPAQYLKVLENFESATFH